VLSGKRHIATLVCDAMNAPAKRDRKPDYISVRKRANLCAASTDEAAAPLVLLPRRNPARRVSSSIWKSEASEANQRN
jgi:hypothetical protein